MKNFEKVKYLLLSVLILSIIAIFSNVFFGYLVDATLLNEAINQGEKTIKYVISITFDTLCILMLIAAIMVWFFYCKTKKQNLFLIFCSLSSIGSTLNLALMYYINQDVNVIKILLGLSILVINCISLMRVYLISQPQNKEDVICNVNLMFKFSSLVLIFVPILVIVNEILFIYRNNQGNWNVLKSVIYIVLSIILITLLFSYIFYKNILTLIASWAITLSMLLINPIIFILVVCASIFIIFSITSMMKIKLSNVNSN
ncbi:hypothetical protein SLITO_v1c07650 [Spiroplasma litorale]|uniref:Uncharacterized protein n=1 Tax=Spiroplasma litorale TaxID=216942 RepID=A0A0K1W2I9_9MOLU|nr:hypothetical protein [Spiroplasma litorale]AKX34388.1 hypothetical protein SLITO_v1c07650 [Spiroplasma litorale]